MKANKTLLGLRPKSLSSVCWPPAEGALDQQGRGAGVTAVMDTCKVRRGVAANIGASPARTTPHQHSDDLCCRRDGPPHQAPIPHPRGNLLTWFPGLSGEVRVPPRRKEFLSPPPVNQCISILANIILSCDVGDCPRIPEN